jgi:hypothetical protein
MMRLCLQRRDAAIRQFVAEIKNISDGAQIGPSKGAT